MISKFPDKELDFQVQELIRIIGSPRDDRIGSSARHRSETSREQGPALGSGCKCFRWQS